MAPVRILFDDEVLRIPHKMLDGVNSLSRSQRTVRPIGTSLSAARYLRAFYQNSAQPKGGIFAA